MKDRIYLNPRHRVIEADYIILKHQNAVHNDKSDLILRARKDVIFITDDANGHDTQEIINRYKATGDSVYFYNKVDNPYDILVECPR